jgi:hypothetical protein
MMHGIAHRQRRSNVAIASYQFRPKAQEVGVRERRRVEVLLLVLLDM